VSENSGLLQTYVECFNSLPSHPILVMAKSSSETIWDMEELMNQRLFLLVNG
jgi:hypothetical protein